MTYIERLNDETSDINIRELTHEQFVADDNNIICYMEGEEDDKVFYLFYITKFYTDYNIRIEPSKRKHDIYEIYNQLNGNEITKQKIQTGNFLFLTDKDYSDFAKEGWEKVIFENDDFFKTKNHSLENYFVTRKMLEELLYYFSPNTENKNISMIAKFENDYSEFANWFIPVIALFSINAEKSNPNLKIDSIKLKDNYNIKISGSQKKDIQEIEDNILNIANINVNNATHSINDVEYQEKISIRKAELEQKEINEIIRGKQALDFFIEYSGLLKKEQSFFKKNKRNKILSLVFHKNFDIPSDLNRYLTMNLTKLQ